MSNTQSSAHRLSHAVVLAVSLLIATGLIACRDPARARQVLPLLAAAATVSLHRRRTGTLPTVEPCTSALRCRMPETGE